MKPLRSFVALYSLCISASWAAEPSFEGFNDAQLLELAFYTNHWCRGGVRGFDEKAMEYVCELRDASWRALGKRGYCYDQFGKEMFPKCKSGGEEID